ncbi:MAG: hypothetical protein NUV57_03905 [archaeon]|nr:hypothetical protein [archaeon]
MKIESKLLVKAKDIIPTRKTLRVRGVFNPSAVRLPNKKIMLLVRVAETPYHDEKTFLAPHFVGTKEMDIHVEKTHREKLKIYDDCFRTDEDIVRLPTISHIRKIFMDETGMNVESISDKPDFYGLKGDGDFGVEDPRVTYFKKEKRYAMTYVSVSTLSGVSTSLATTKNFNDWKREGIIFRQQNKDVVIYPEKINGYYAAMHRPEGTMVFDKPRIWISYSKDLIFWGRDKPLLGPRKQGWDNLRIGPGSVPIKTNEGWLEIYHGVHLKKKNDPNSDKVYNAGAILFDLKNPEKIIGRTPANKPIFKPNKKLESGNAFNDNVTFPSAVIPDLNNKDLLIYSGEGDSNTSVRKIKLKDILNSLK